LLDDAKDDVAEAVAVRPDAVHVDCVDSQRLKVEFFHADVALCWRYHVDDGVVVGSYVS
jgi:hypothetical protein